MKSDVSQLRRRAEDLLNVPARLHSYQWEGVSFLYQSQAALLADEMGLGKTVQTAVALALVLNARNEINRALIVAPTSLTTNWMVELSAWAPSLTVRRVQGVAAAREAFYLLPIPVLVSSYEQIRHDGLDRIPSGAFDLVILDEAQRIKNRNSATAFACRLLPRKRAWALSATPLENDANDVASILSFLDSSVRPHLSQTHLSDKLRSMMLRRRKSAVRAELPPVIFQELQIELTLPQRERYDQLWVNRVDAIKESAAGRNISTALLGLLTRLKSICNFDPVSDASSKLDALRSIVEGAGESARILVFSQFVETLRWISARIDLPHGFLTGSMSLPERATAMRRFREDPAPRGLLVSLRAGGVGLNLGEATHVVMFDRWWNPAVEVQAIYRAHRFCRDAPLHVVSFLVADSVEERISAILEEKEALFDEIVESAAVTPHRFTNKEFMRVLELTVDQIFSPAHTIEEIQSDGEDR